MATDKNFGACRLEISKSDLVNARAALIGVEKGFPVALRRAINKTVDGVKTDMISLVRDRYNYYRAIVSNRIKKNKASNTRFKASVVSSGPGVHLTDIVRTRQTAKGVSVDVKKETGRKVIEHAFIAGGRHSDKQIVFIRELGENNKRVPRTPIRALYAPHPEVVMNVPNNWKMLQRQADERLDVNFNHEVDVVLKGIA
jgi:hypothetical protein